MHIIKFGIYLFTFCTDAGINPHSDDIYLPESIISIPSGATRVPVPLEIIDDAIVEELYETIRINIAPFPEQQALFAMEFTRLLITIKDNDSKFLLIMQVCRWGGGGARECIYTSYSEYH